MRAFLTGAVIGLTGYTLGIIAARQLAKRHDPINLYYCPTPTSPQTSHPPFAPTPHDQ
jgi:hypothetical protein